MLILIVVLTKVTRNTPLWYLQLCYDHNTPGVGSQVSMRGDGSHSSVHTLNISLDCNEILFIVTQHRTLLQHWISWTMFGQRVSHPHTSHPISGLRSSGCPRNLGISAADPGHCLASPGPCWATISLTGRARLLAGNLIFGVNIGHRAQRVERESGDTACLLDTSPEHTKTTDSSM